jgi:hypothetical protein
VVALPVRIPVCVRVGVGVAVLVETPYKTDIGLVKSEVPEMSIISNT